MKLSAASFTVFDFETTGLYPYSGDRICEIGAVRMDAGGRKLKKFQSLVNPKRPISPGAFSVNGITAAMVRGKPGIETLLPEFLRFIDGSVLVAYNAGFDLGFLEHALGEERALLDTYYIIDALGLARKLFPKIGRYSLGSVAKFLGLDTGNEHRALADALTTWGVFKAELEILKANDIVHVEEIARIAISPRPAAAAVKDYKLALIESAIREQKKLNITYRSSWNNTITKRTITPRKIQPGFDRSYIIAVCHLRNEERNFRLDGIIDAEECR